MDKNSDTPQDGSHLPKPELETPLEPSTPTVEGGARDVLGLALPALGALVIEPLLLVIDSVMIGYLGTAPLAGLSLASTVLLTIVGVFVFLAYSTTALTAQAVGAGKRTEGVQAGVQAIWLAFGLGVVLATSLTMGAPWLVKVLGADAQIAGQAVLYLRGSAFGIIGMLVILAATGTLRGLLDMTTPLYVVAAGATLNIALNFLLIFGLGLHILGAGIALSITQTLMAIALVYAILKKSRGYGIALAPARSGLAGAFREGLPLLIRTISLRAALLATVTVATSAGVVALAAHQVVNSIWTLAAFILDALAIAAQSLVGIHVGSGDGRALHSLTRRLILWGVGAALVLGLIIFLGAPWIPDAFGTDEQMRVAATSTLRVAGVMMPIAGVVFILDGVLIGASDGKYLAYMGVVTLVAYLPALFYLHHRVTAATAAGDYVADWALPWLWVAFAGWFMLLRAVTNSARALSPRFGAKSPE